jgi:FlaA1/EpsC-like NDP-sugar epimerase
MLNFNVDNFIKEHITKRSESLFLQDIREHQSLLKEKITGKKVLVIGGAGTIGSSYIKAILPFHPASLTVVDYSENGLTELTRDLRSRSELTVPGDYITYPFDFGGSVFEKLMTQSRFDIIACFAAHKHVRSEKDPLAIEAMVNNNVFNTARLLKLAGQKKPEHFFSVSTDKAANPVNVMGASKKLMEKVLLASANDIKISTARFANVAFSNGSLLFGFIQRIMKRQPLSSPSDVKRYFVSPIESGQLCMIASLLGETGDIFFPKLREDQMMTFSNIAEKFLTELGLECDYCNSEAEAKTKAQNWNPSIKKYPVYFFSTNTSGEKMYEEFYDNNDVIDNNSFKQLGIIKNSKIPSAENVQRLLIEFKNLFSGHIEKSDIISLLNTHLPDFSHIETGNNLDQKM